MAPGCLAGEFAQYNPFFLSSAIEKYWWSAKSHYNKRVMAQSEEITEQRFRELVLESVNSIPVDKVHRLCTSNRKYVAQLLQT